MSRSQNKVYLTSDSLFLNIRDTVGDASLYSEGRAEVEGAGAAAEAAA